MTGRVVRSVTLRSGEEECSRSMNGVGNRELATPVGDAMRDGIGGNGWVTSATKVGAAGTGA